MNRFLRQSGRRLVVFTVALGMAVVGAFSDLRSQTQDQAGAADESRFEVPDGNAQELHEYIEELAQTPPEGETEEEQIKFSMKALSALVEAADRLLKAEPTAEQAKDAHGYRIEALTALVAMESMTKGDGAEKRQEQLNAALQAARESDQEEVAAMGWQRFIQDRTGNWSRLEDAEKQAFRDEVMAKIDEGGPDPLDVSIVNVAAMGLEQAQRGDSAENGFLLKFLTDANEKLKASDSAEVKEQLKEANLEGMIRRLNLPGNQIEISGQLLGGGEVDWQSYRGKVVLVDFWATWCGPCRAELPNILEMYDAYHEKGFEVLGVSLDDTAKEAKKFVADKKLPWDSIFPQNEDERKFDHPLVKYYGINGIPTAILVDQEGRVVSMNARGPELRRQLQTLLGEPAEDADSAADRKAEKAAASS